MPKNGEQYLAGLRDGRAIYIDGERVENHVDHAAFSGGVRSTAAMYDHQAKAENQRAMTFESPTSGGLVSRIWQLPTNQTELEARRYAMEAWAGLTYGFMGRSPDHVASALAGMYIGMDLYRAHGEKYAKALEDYYAYARDKDLYLTYAIVSPQADRSKGAGEQQNEFVAAGVADEDSEGITIRGAKMLATACPMANEVMVAAIQPLKPGEEKYSFTAMVPLNAKGLKLLSRKSYEAAAGSEFDNPLSKRFDENDCVLYFDDVKVPWSRVFVHNDVAMAQAQWHKAPTHVYQNYQCQVRLMVKMRFLLGLGRKIAETNGVIAIPAVREILGQMASEVAMVEGLVEATEATGVMYGKYYMPNPRRLYPAMVLTQQLYPKFVQQIRELSGGGLIMLPSSANDFANDEIAKYIGATQHSPTTDAEGRVKLFKLAWDAVGSEFGSRHMQYEMFYAGANMVTRGHAYRTADWERARGMVDQLMASYGVAGAKGK